MGLVDQLYKSIMPCSHYSAVTVAQIVSASDTHFKRGSVNVIPEKKVDSPAPELLVEIEHLRQENECMKIHLSTELEKLREDNKQLHLQLREMTAHSHSSIDNPASNLLPPSHSDASHYLSASPTTSQSTTESSDLDDTVV